MGDDTYLQDSVEQLLRTVDALDETDFRSASRLPGWTRAHVITHLARASDSRTGLLIAARAGTVGRQYPSAASRAREIEIGAARPGPAISSDLHDALQRFIVAVRAHPEHLWDVSGEWLGPGRRPVRRAVPSMRREVEYHHVDLDAGYRPEDWPADFVRAQLPSVVDSMAGRPDAPAVTIELPERTLRIGSGELVTVTGDPADLLAWLTGRGNGSRLNTAPAGPLPALPPLA